MLGVRARFRRDRASGGGRRGRSFHLCGTGENTHVTYDSRNNSNTASVSAIKLSLRIRIIAFRVQIRRLPLLQPSRSPLRSIRPSFVASGRQSATDPVSNKSMSDSSTLPVAGQAARSIANQEAAAVLKQLKERMALSGPKYPKEYHEIDESLAHPYLRPGAPWGFVIIRAIYGPSSDAPWAKMLELLRLNVREELTLSDQADLLVHHELTVLEDEATLAGADSYAVRRTFRAWVAGNLPQRLTDSTITEYGGTEKIRDKLRSNEAHFKVGSMHPATSVPPRWQFCIFVDADCLCSLDMGLDFEAQDPALKILTTDWELAEESTSTEEFTHDWDGGETDNDSEMVGWMYIEMSDYVPKYASLVRAADWYDFSQRPNKSWPDQLHGVDM